MQQFLKIDEFFLRLKNVACRIIEYLCLASISAVQRISEGYQKDKFPLA